MPPEEVSGATAQATQDYSILKQRVDLDVNFACRSLKGSTEITIQPLIKDLKQVRLHCRQCRPTAIQVDGITAQWQYRDAYKRSQMPDNSDVRQHDMLKERIEQNLKPEPQPELTVAIPQRVKIQELQVETAATLPQSHGAPSIQRQESDAVALTAETLTALAAAQQAPQFAPVKVSIEFEVSRFRDGIHWIGYDDDDRRFPSMYTKVEPWPGNLSCIFPCVDDATSRCSWEFAIQCARTLGDAFRRPKSSQAQIADAGSNEDTNMINGDAATALNGNTEMEDDYVIDISAEEATMDLTIICVGGLADDVIDTEDETRHTATFSLAQPVCARHIGFAIGPFEHVNLSAARDSEEEERLGQSAIKVDGYCLPGKRADLLNTCYPTAWAMDHMGIKYGSFPFGSYQIIFVDDLVYDTAAAAGLSFCSSHLLCPKTVIEPLYRNTRTLIRALADQWSGVNVIAKEPTDAWVVAGMAGFMTDAYMKELCGNNEFRWRQKLAAETVYDLDVDRPSMRQLGELLHLDSSIRDFVDVKSALVLFILDRRLMKASGNTGVQRIINKIFLNAKTGSLVNSEVSMQDFQRTCERLGHNKLETFFRQWIFGSGVPIFYVTQRFNKKKLVVEMTIVQKQLDRVTKPEFAPNNFMREIKEYTGEVWAPETNPVFRGPMTIRIHEADGTPYEHIVEIKESTTRLEIPYSTKYKRLKRSRRQRERAQQQQQQTASAEGAGDGDEGALLYCLGDILDSEEEKREWRLADWTEEDEEKMGQESYEWIRMDADFEWIGKIHLVMPLYMYISQLQQDRDIVAQYESMRYLLGSNPHHVSFTILVRTLMDARYFWGIREMAANGLAICAKDQWIKLGAFHLTKAFRELFCIGGTNMPKSNDFSNPQRFVIQCAIPKAMAKLRDAEGKAPMDIRQFFVDLIKFNDNSNNAGPPLDAETNDTFSDNHYIAVLLNCLADSLVASHREPQPSYTFTFGDEEPMIVEQDDPDGEFEKTAIAQIERIRRIDEWDPSYQNIYSITALECLQKLTKAGIVKDKTKEVMKYVRAGNADNVRLVAWRCLSEIGVLGKMPAMKFLLHCLSEDRSPRFRDRLLTIFGEALGHVALGDPEPAGAALQPAADTGLVLEQEVSSETRRLEAARKSTPEGALVALRAAMANEEAFKQALWSATTAPHLTLDGIASLCDIAALIYDPVYSLILELKLPRLWHCENLGQGRVKFLARGPVRTAPRKGLLLRDWDNLEALGLQYNGPLGPEVLKKQQADNAPLKLRIGLQPDRSQQLAPDDQSRPPSTTPVQHMPPPSSTITPSNEKPPSVKLNLGVKRKQSVDLAPARGVSPKVQKTSRQQSPAESIRATPRGKGSPARSQRRSSTPGSRASVPGQVKSHQPVVLRLGKNAAQAQAILSSPPQPGRTAATPVHLHGHPFANGSPQSMTYPSTLVQSPTNSTNYFTGSTFAPSPLQTMNLGGFRSYGPVPNADAEDSIGVKREPAASPTAASPIATSVESPELPREPSQEQNQDMPPPPRKKLTLKLGNRRPSVGGSQAPLTE